MVSHLHPEKLSGELSPAQTYKQCAMLRNVQAPVSASVRCNKKESRWQNQGKRKPLSTKVTPFKKSKNSAILGDIGR
jgi:hypothetical protein